MVNLRDLLWRERVHERFSYDDSQSVNTLSSVSRWYDRKIIKKKKNIILCWRHLCNDDTGDLLFTAFNDLALS